MQYDSMTLKESHIFLILSRLPKVQCFTIIQDPRKCNLNLLSSIKSLKTNKGEPKRVLSTDHLSFFHTRPKE
jgi:hypothetical protein